jgi:hypothetical protein
VHPVVAALPLEEKGLVLGALLARMPPDDAAARFGGDIGTRCRAALEAISAETRSGRAAALAALISLVRAPVPAGVERVHPGWLRERMAPESVAVIRAVVDGLPIEVRQVADEILSERGETSKGPAPALGAAGLAELRRAVFAGLVPMAGPGLPAGSQAQSLLALSFAALEETIELRGAEALGVSLQGAPAAVIARAAAGLGGRQARVVLDAAARPGPTEGREGARSLVAATAAANPAANPTNVAMAWDLGARSLAGALAAEGSAARQAIAQRLSPARGRRFLAYAGESGG